MCGLKAMIKFRPEYLNPNSVSMGVHPDGQWVRYRDLPWVFRQWLEFPSNLKTLWNMVKTAQDEPKSIG